MSRIPLWMFALALPLCAHAQPAAGSWLDSAPLESWNKPGVSIPSAPQGSKNPDPRCGQLARSPLSDEDRLLRARGWDLIGPPTDADGIRVVGATSDYDGMCRPRRYQFFVFARGVFAGTLSPGLMDSRTDGALSRVTLQAHGKLQVRYSRYAPADPLCCPSRTTTVLFGVAQDPPSVRPLTATTASNQSAATPQ